MTAGSLVKRRGTEKMGVIIEILAPDGSFATWAVVMWSDGFKETHDVKELELISCGR